MAGKVTIESSVSVNGLPEDDRGRQIHPFVAIRFEAIRHGENGGDIRQLIERVR